MNKSKLNTRRLLLSGLLGILLPTAVGHAQKPGISRDAYNAGSGIILPGEENDTSDPNPSLTPRSDPATDGLPQNAAHEAIEGESNRAGDGTKRELGDNIQRQKNNDKSVLRALDDARKLNARSIMDPKANNPAEAQKIRNDQILIKEADEAEKKNKPYPQSKAKQAQNPEIQKDLLIVSRGLKERTELKREESRLNAQLAQFGKLAAAAAAAAGALGEIKNPNSKVSNAQPTYQKSKDNGVSSSKEAKEDSSSVSAELTDEKIKGLSKEEKIAMLKELLGGGTYKGTKIKDASLRSKLIAQLQAAEAAERKSAANMGSIAENVKRENAAAKVVSDVLTPSPEGDGSFIAAGGKASNTFSLSTSETNAEVKRMTDEAAAQLAANDPAGDDLKSGILETDSASLFERIKAHLTSCLKQRCVNSRVVAKN